MNRRLPQPAAAVLEALRLDRSGPILLPDSWPDALAYTDQSFLTLHWRRRLVAGDAWGCVPEDIRCRLDRNLAGNAERLRRTEALLEEMEARFVAAGVDFVRLKGLSHARTFVADPQDRVQYDLDFYCPPGSIYRARDVLLKMGYEPLSALEDLPTDHLPIMIRRTGWRWRGDYFDPDHPLSIDLHFRFWDADTEQLPAPSVEQFWERRIGCELDPADQLGYAALHALRHVLRGSLRPAHVYEIALLVHRRHGDIRFWSRWRDLHPPELRGLEAIVFGLAREYFGCPAPEPPPEAAAAWIGRFGWSPLEGAFRPNKHEILLHLALVAGSGGSRWKVLRRRLVPMRLPDGFGPVHVPTHQITSLLRLQTWAAAVAFVAARVVHHGRVLLPTLWMLLRWRRGRS